MTLSSGGAKALGDVHRLACGQQGVSAPGRGAVPGAVRMAALGARARRRAPASGPGRARRHQGIVPVQAVLAKASATERRPG